MKKSLIFISILALLSSCKQNSKFNINGNVKDAAGQILYFEHNGLLKTTVLDSVKLSSDGSFSFRSARPEYPDFYRLRLNNKTITFAVDSCESINFTAKETNFATNYTVTGSVESLKIQLLRKSVMNIQQKANNLAEYTNEIIKTAKVEEIKQDIEVHKSMARKLILENPRSSSAYFALYQMVNEAYLFSPYAKEDKPYCAAVATSYNTFMPEYVRSKNLYSLVMDAIRSERSAKAKQVWDEILEKSGKGYFEIELKDKKELVHKLSELEGKVVLIDFSTFESNESVNYTFALRDLYNKYHSRGFEIYQISLDQNKQLWENAVENIPWISVRDKNGANTVYASTYNLSTLPTTFLMNKKGDIISRSPNFDELNKLIAENL